MLNVEQQKIYLLNIYIEKYIDFVNAKCRWNGKIWTISIKLMKTNRRDSVEKTMEME